jgi:ATP-dependent DNA helicase RecQ
VSRTGLATALHRLEEAGAVEVLEDGSVRAIDADEPTLEAAVEDAAAAEEHRLAFDRSRVEMMRGYAETRGCRRAFLLGYFGEAYEPPCGNCEAGLVKAHSAAAQAGWQGGERVRHSDWGEGTVGQVEGDQLTIVFDDVGYKTLAVELIEERGLLERI